MALRGGRPIANTTSGAWDSDGHTLSYNAGPSIHLTFTTENQAVLIRLLAHPVALRAVAAHQIVRFAR